MVGGRLCKNETKLNWCFKVSVYILYNITVVRIGKVKKLFRLRILGAGVSD